MCRSTSPINQTVKDKISNFCHVRPEQVSVCTIMSRGGQQLTSEPVANVCVFRGGLWLTSDPASTSDHLPCAVLFQVVAVHDLSSVYRVPLLLEKQGVLNFLLKRLKIPIPSPTSSKYLLKWKNLADRYARMYMWKDC